MRRRKKRCNHRRRGAAPGYTWRELDPIDVHPGHASWETLAETDCPGTESQYGNPEEALVVGREDWVASRESKIDEREGVREEMRAAMQHAHMVDWLILELADRGVCQEIIAARVGLSQPSVSSRQRKMREWLARVVPHRMRARQHPTPVWHPLRPIHGTGRQHTHEEMAAVWELTFWGHRQQSAVGRALGLKQGRVARVQEHCVQVLEACAHPDLARAGRAMVNAVMAWQRPPVRSEHLVPSLRPDPDREIKMMLDLLEGV